MLNNELINTPGHSPHLQSSDDEKISLQSLVKTKLKPLPGNVTKILSLLRDVNVTTKKVCDVISLDPILVTRLLRLANSPIYSYQKDITTVEQAVSAIGIKSVYDIVVLGLASDNFSRESEFPNSGVSIWEHSVAVGVAARELSNLLQIRGTEEAFICGLLHDFGITLLFQNNPGKCKEVYALEDEEAIIRLEEKTFGYNHMQIGYHVSHAWDLPEAVCASILYHHFPTEAQQAVVMSHIINVADELAKLKGMGMLEKNEEERTKMPQSASTKLLRLSEENMNTMWSRTEANLKEIMKSLH